MPSFHYEDMFVLKKPLKVRISGSVVSGVVTPGMQINLDGFLFTINSIEGSFGKLYTETTVGQHVSLQITYSGINSKPKHRYFWNRLLFREKLDPAYEIFSKFVRKVIEIS